MMQVRAIRNYLLSYLPTGKNYKFDINAYAECLSDNVKGSLVNLGNLSTNKHFNSKTELIKFIEEQNDLAEIHELKMLNSPLFSSSALNNYHIARAVVDDMDGEIFGNSARFHTYKIHNDCLTCMLTLEIKAVTKEGKVRFITDHQSYQVKEKIEFVSHHWISNEL